MSDENETEATEAERAQADALAKSIDDAVDPAPGTDAAMVGMLSASRAGAELDPAVRARLVGRAVTGARAARRRRWVRPAVVSFALAAAVLLVLRFGGDGTTPPPRAYGGPASSVFAAPFPDDEPASARLDRLTRARTREYFDTLLPDGDAR